MEKIHSFILDLNLTIINKLSAIDRFGGEWEGIERRQGRHNLMQLKSFATVQSTGASTRIEGSRIMDEKVKHLISEVRKDKFTDRDEQEVLGYYTALDIISESWSHINITESSIKSLHNQLLKYCTKDQYHKGNYKSSPNSVEALHPDGTKTLIFKPTPPGIETAAAMRALVEWYRNDEVTPSLIKVALFVYDFLSIHPFQDGNGRLSRLLSTLLLLQNKYKWIEYVSFEHEIENRKLEYYEILMECQQQRPGENVTPWLNFFLDCLINIQSKLANKLKKRNQENQLSPRERKIYTYVDNYPGCQSGEISKKLKIPLPTVKKQLAEMVNRGLLLLQGKGAGTNYITEKMDIVQQSILFKFNQEFDTNTLDFKSNVLELTLPNRYSYVSIRKILINPNFKWEIPNDWANVFHQQVLGLKITYKTALNLVDYSDIYLEVSSFNSHPEIDYPKQIDIPTSILGKIPNDNEFPIYINIELICAEKELKFDVRIVYDLKVV